jgi:hypothetical protein
VAANCTAFDTAPVAEPIPLARATRRDRLAIARIARSLGRGPRADLEERMAGGE